jgi:hypothetical protein
MPEDNKTPETPVVETPVVETPVVETPKPEAKKVKSSRMTIEEICAEYPDQKIVAGSLGFLEDEQKQTVRIACSVEGCNRERTVRTSDLWQVEMCEACTRKERRGRARARRQARKAEVKVS